MKVNELLDEGTLQDVVKGVKRTIAGKPTKDQLANRRLAKATELYKKSDKADSMEQKFDLFKRGDKEFKRYNKLASVAGSRTMAEGLFDKKPKTKLNTRDFTPEERALIKKYVPHSNTEYKSGDKPLFPRNAHGVRGHGDITFYTEDDVLMASVGWYQNKDDAGKPRKSPLTHIEVKLASEADFKKLVKLVDADELSESWKSKAAGLALAGAVTAGIIASPPAYVGGDRYELALSIPPGATDVKTVKSDDGATITIFKAPGQGKNSAKMSKGYVKGKK